MFPSIFLHIPKCGGSSLNDWFEEVSKLNNLYYLRSGGKDINNSFKFDYFYIQNKPDLYFDIKNKKIFDKSILSGHFVYDDCLANFSLIMCLWSVEDIFFSSVYFHYFRTYRQKNYVVETVKNLDLFNLSLKMNSDDETALKYLLDNDLITSNIITKFFAGIENNKFFFSDKDLKIDEKIYETAKFNLKKFSYIFPLEKTAAFCEKFCKDNKLTNIKYQHKNKSSNKIYNYDPKIINNLKVAIRQKILEYNEFDYKLLKFLNFYY